ncbi:MAG TPA: hypothetical protein VM870_06895 [Pyrinomonadaceae bacterium]|jgi:hypothetical protein|nr:hypothetical protein [Pyrinomonadaceae bacterium]
MQKPSHAVTSPLRLILLLPVALLSLIPINAANAAGTPGPASSTNVVCRAGLSVSRRQLLTDDLRQITGWANLHFDEQGGLHRGNAAAAGGSAAARELLGSAIAGDRVIVIEDASDRDDVVFCRVVPAAWKRPKVNAPRAYVVLIDFADFSHVIGDSAARAAFNPGWSVLHEIAHAVHDVNDAEKAGDELGDCERLINAMRQECGLAERAEYWYRIYPNMESSAFPGRFVRLAFVRQPPNENKKQRYWLMWDANLVGGPGAEQSARTSFR